jgi:glutaredoxin
MFQRRSAARRGQDDPTQPGERHLVTLVTRRECHLCADAQRLLTRLAGELPFDLQELDVDADPARRDEYSDRVPVILIDGREHGYWRVEEARFRRAIAKPVRR